MIYALKNSVIYTGNEKLSGRVLLIEDDIIKAIVDQADIPEGTEIIDYSAYSVAPGLIDLQIAGAGGYLFSENPTVAALKAITGSIVKSGTTGFLIAVPTNSFDTYRKIIDVVKNNPHPAVLGLHLEGPYINKEKGGAHNSEYIKKTDREEVKELLDYAQGAIKMITLAPELCDQGFIATLINYGVTVAAGHSKANFKEASDGFEWGVRACTHLFNAMSPFHHRDPGLPGATFDSETACASIIVDGIHVDYHAVSIAKKIMKERLYLVSDAVEENSEGAYLHKKREDRFTLPDGTLSGSKLTMLEAVRNCIKHVDIPVDEALRMASGYPARLIGMDKLGFIIPGYKANLTVFNTDFIVKQVVIGGKFCLPFD
ncbi:MAG: N-acetylglucosamine-6-phosphate deacetylase [Bacteroidales bacterium]|nr:N-acetylglucosamine-6-phosphate deacetylase [Bacteroidales bacterium]